MIRRIPSFFFFAPLVSQNNSLYKVEAERYKVKKLLKAACLCPQKQCEQLQKEIKETTAERDDLHQMAEKFRQRTVKVNKDIEEEERSHKKKMKKKMVCIFICTKVQVLRYFLAYFCILFLCQSQKGNIVLLVN